MAAADDENMLDSNKEEMCKFCLKEKSQYTCPRCNVRYCSLVCYKCVAHAQCSEGFYRDCFMEGLKDMKSPEDKAKVLQMLKRVAEEQSPLDSDDEDDDLEERMVGLDLDKDSDIIWSQLTSRERSEFRSMIQDGRIGELVSFWQPWWVETEKPGLVQEVTSVEGDSLVMKTIPSTVTDIPDIHSLLSSKSPAESLRYSVINIIYGYAYISRLYNGDYAEYPDQCVQELLHLCSAFGTTTYKDASEAIQTCVHCLANQAKSLYISRQFTVAIISDVQQIIHGPGPCDQMYYVAAALSELHRLFTRAVKMFTEASRKKSIKDSHSAMIEHVQPRDELRQLKHQCFSAVKKLEFLLSWIQEFGVQLLELEPILQVEFCEMSSLLAAHKNTETKLGELREKMNRKTGHKLIEEVVPSGD